MNLPRAGFPLNFKLGRLVEILSPAERSQIRQSRRNLTSPSPAATCPAHEGNPLEYYCEQCKLLICGQCMLSDHRVHDGVLFARDALPQHLEVFSSLLSAANIAASQASAASEKLKAGVKELRQQCEEKSGRIRAFFGRVQQLLSEREQELLDDVQQEQEEREEWAAGAQQSVQKALESVRNDIQVSRVDAAWWIGLLYTHTKTYCPAVALACNVYTSSVVSVISTVAYINSTAKNELRRPSFVKLGVQRL